MHTYYNECPRCGALLDPGERCSCTDDKDHHQDDGSQDLFYDLLAEQQENQR